MILKTTIVVCEINKLLCNECIFLMYKKQLSRLMSTVPNWWTDYHLCIYMSKNVQVYSIYLFIYLVFHLFIYIFYCLVFRISVSKREAASEYLFYSKYGFHYCSQRNNVVVLLGTLKVQSLLLPKWMTVVCWLSSHLLLFPKEKTC